MDEEDIDQSRKQAKNDGLSSFIHSQLGWEEVEPQEDAQRYRKNEEQHRKNEASGIVEPVWEQAHLPQDDPEGDYGEQRSSEPNSLSKGIGRSPFVNLYEL
mgnify:CR=1 FL=1